jgi:putative spermidine/putrescine transport system permease protein
MLLVVPLTLFLLVIFLVPVASMLSLAVTETTVQPALPRTVEALRGWNGASLPHYTAFAALADDLAAGRGEPELTAAAWRLNQDTAGLRGTVVATARALEVGGPGGDARARVIAADPAWSKVETWGAIRRTAGPMSDTELLAALDLRRDAQGVIGPVDPERAIYRQVLLRTLATALLITVLSAALGYPLAALLARAPARLAGWLALLVLLPLWTGVLVRTAAWMALLARHGPINQTLLTLGLFATPREFLFTRFAVVVAMLHILLPYMILPLYAVMRRIPNDHLRAAASLGASPARAFWRIWLPQTAPGIGAGVLMVFIQGLGFYVTPALLGSGADQMLPWFIGYAANQSGEWGLAAALSLVLLVAVALLAAVWSRIARLRLVRTA